MTQRISVFGSVALGVLALWYLFVYAPTSHRLRQLRADANEVERQLQDYNQTLADLPEFLEANESLEQLRGRLNSSLFAKNDILDLFDQITVEASKYNLKLIEITPPVSELLELNRRASMANEPQFLNITLHFEGGYVDFGQYVSRLEKKPYFRSVNSCVIRGNQLLQPVVDLSVSFKALIGTVEEG